MSIDEYEEMEKSIFNNVKRAEKEDKKEILNLIKNMQNKKGKEREKIWKKIWKRKNRKLNRKHKNDSYQRNKKIIVIKQVKYQKIYRDKNRLKVNARAVASRIKIQKAKMCEICNKKLADAKHHEDYSKPKEVIFCCRGCHAILDKIRRLREKDA